MRYLEQVVSGCRINVAENVFISFGNGTNNLSALAIQNRNFVVLTHDNKLVGMGWMKEITAVVLRIKNSFSSLKVL